MTKITITERQPFDWIGYIDGCTKEEAITYLQSLPDGSQLYAEPQGYDGLSDGEVFLACEETDKEYAARLEAERKANEKAAIKAVETRLGTQQNIDATIAQLTEKIEMLKKVRPA